jgi:hypothetical protein
LHANQPSHFIAAPEKHLANLPLEPLRQDHLHRARPDPEKFLHPRKTLLDGKTLPHLRRQGEIELLVQRDDVGLAQLARRMRQPLGEVAVVRHHQQSLGILVEPPDINHSRPAGGEKIVNRPLVRRVGRGAEITGRLVQNGHEHRRRLHRLAVDEHMVRLVDLRGQLAQPMTVDRDRPLQDQRFTRAAGAKTGPGKKLVQSHGLRLGLNEGKKQSKPCATGENARKNLRGTGPRLVRREGGP